MRVRGLKALFALLTLTKSRTKQPDWNRVIFDFFDRCNRRAYCAVRIWKNDLPLGSAMASMKTIGIRAGASLIGKRRSVSAQELLG